MQFDDLNFGMSVDQDMYSAADLMQLQIEDVLFEGVVRGCTVCTYTCSHTT